MTTPLGIWAQFALLVLLNGIAGSKLSRYGDAIAEKTGLSGNWIGIILLATVTSLPELAAFVRSNLSRLAEPNRTEPSRAKPGQAEPSQGRAGLDRV